MQDSGLDRGNVLVTRQLAVNVLPIDRLDFGRQGDHRGGAVNRVPAIKVLAAILL